MSVFDKSGSAFYDSTGQSSSTVDTEILSAPEHSTGPVTPPPYDMHGGGGAESFGPIDSGVSDSSFQPVLADVPNPTFTFQPWMLLVAGAVLVMLLRETRR